ncbi:MAG: hypothetical protein COA77_08125 [Thaumarchaeota archaeon]|nr:MAG: hypothetical protein COA77_08125 [Nitrososphaerota archaeon]
MGITKFQRHLSDSDIIDGDIGGPAQKIGNEIATLTYFITIADGDHEMFYYDKKARIWRENGTDFIWKFVAEKYSALSKVMLNEVIHYIQGQTLLPRMKFQPPNGLLAFENHCIDAIHNYADEFDSYDHYIRNKFPVVINKKATCPKFSKFLNQVLPNYEDRCTLLELMSMVLIPQINFEKAGMFIGTSSANGKSTILRLMSELFGKKNIVSISLQDLINDRFMGQKLDGKSLNIYADINDKKITDLDKFKLFVSGDSITVQRKNGHPYEIIPKAKHFFSTNTLPEIQEDNNAVYRRFIIIEFPNSFEGKEDFDLFDKLTTKDELEGIMWLLLRTAKRLSRKRQFTFKQTPSEIRMRWKQQSNAVFEMIEKSIGFIIKKNDGRISRAEFYTKYVQFCNSKNYTVNSPGTVTRQVEKLGYKPHKSSDWYWLGLDIPTKVAKNKNQRELF